MNENEPIIFVCTTRKKSFVDWSEASDRFQVLYTTIPDVVLASVRRTNGPGAQEINAVIFDQSVSARTFLEFLSEIACEFRGDVLLVNGEGEGILSTVSVKDGRHIYRLDREDLPFYASARFGIETAITAPAHVQFQYAQSA
ncbi:MAG: hypothetical protein NDJ92_08770 [Thermoanaerobaculia bacterium]|nr:hypothetical protein [Thermoanaerobaculia bacterium]